MSQIVRARRIPPVQQSQMGSMVFGAVSQSDNMELFDDRIRQFEAEGKIPDLNMEAEYTIYRWKSGFGRHESIVFGFQGKFFTIEIRAMNKKMNLYMTAEGIDVDKLKNIGKKIGTGAYLFAKAYAVYQSRGSNYSLAGYNCQHFANEFLQAIEMKDQVTTTDSDWLFKIGSVAAVGVAALIGLATTRANRRQ